MSGGNFEERSGGNPIVVLLDNKMPKVNGLEVLKTTTSRAVVVTAALGPDILAASTGTTATYSGVISGSGALVVGCGTNAGTIVITGDANITGGTTINAGTLQIGNGGNIGSIEGDVINNGALTFDRGDSVTLAGAVSGAGTLNQVGPGLWL
jgi:fibronectin-binding autotransporter adhesin